MTALVLLAWMYALPAGCTFLAALVFFAWTAPTVGTPWWRVPVQAVLCGALWPAAWTAVVRELAPGWCR